MTALALLTQARSDGVTLRLVPPDRLKLAGDPELLEKWAPILRPHKTGLVDILSTESHHRWVLTYPGMDPVSLVTCPPEPRASIEARYPGALVKPWAPEAHASPMTATEVEVVRQHLIEIGEPPDGAGEVLAACMEDSRARAFWLARASAFLHTDDRRTCRQCSNLSQSGGCAAAGRGELIGTDLRYRPPPDVPRRCEGYAPGPADPDRRPGPERWPSLLTPDMGKTDNQRTKP